MNYNFLSIYRQFLLYGDFRQARPYGNGHINDTFEVICEQAGKPMRYIFQRINHLVFKDPVKLMDNISRVCTHIQGKLTASGDSDSSRRALTVIPSREGLPYYRDDNGNFWRCYLFVEGALGFDIIENEDQAFQAARAFGRFQNYLTDIPEPRLHETIPDFHNTPKRFSTLLKAVDADSFNRLEGVREELDFILERRSIVSRLVELHEQGLVPERITHNDTKLNNVLIDEQTHQGICVIDLDTTMPGLAPYDFGELIRTSTSPAPEDERDLSIIHVQKNMFRALAAGYLNSAGNFLTPAEKENLVFGGRLMTLENGIRFLTDYLSGDVYFKIKTPEHNLVRCRSQQALVRSIESSDSELEDIIDEEYRKIT